MKFSDFEIRDDLQDSLARCGFVDCTPIQQICIPPALEGHDIVGEARTGSGKTLAFLVPIINRLEARGEVQALIVCPTRELALQVGAEAEKVGAPLGIRTDVIYGGTSLGHQKKILIEGLDLVAGTPGRLLDFIHTGYLQLRRTRNVVLDEADRMLDMGFIGDVDQILRKAPMSRQTMLFSATLPLPVMNLAHRYMLYPHEFRIEERVTVPPAISQRLYRVAESRKPDLLRALLALEEPDKAIVFTATKKATTEVASRIRRSGFDVHSMSSDLSQSNRERVMQAFREGRCHLIVATDVAARGIDIDDISHIFNYDLPTVAEDYVHRVGRTGRLGRTGVAISLFTPDQEEQVREIERLIGEHIPIATQGDFDPGEARPRSRPAAGGGAGRGNRKRSGGKRSSSSRGRKTGSSRTRR